MIGLSFERQLTPSVRLRRWQLGRAVPRWPSSVHDALELCWVERGRARYRVGQRTIDVEAGAAILVPAGVEHLTEIAPETAAGSMWLSAELVGDAVEAAGAAAPELGAVVRPDLLDRGRALLRAAEGDLDPTLAECAVDGLLLRLLSTRVRFNGTSDPRIRRAIEEIQARHAEPLDVAALARAARMSRYHFSRVFREQTGASPYQFLINTRVERAAELLAAGGANVTEAALAVGFADLGRFGRAFKAQLGRTPSAWLMEHRSPKGRHESHRGSGRRDRSMPACDRRSSSSL